MILPGHYPIFAFYILSRMERFYPDPSGVKEGGGSLSVFLSPFQFFSCAPVGGRESREETGCDILIFYLKLFSQDAVGELANISGSACTKKDVRGLVSVFFR